MNQIIKDSYYLVKLHQDNGECISLRRLTDLLFIYESAFMVGYEKNRIYDEEFLVGTNGIYVREVNDEFEDFEEVESIMINDKRLKAIAKSIPKKKKSDLGFIYRYFREISDEKIHEFTSSEDSPVEEIYNNPELLAFNILHSVPIEKARMKAWYHDYIMGYNKQEEE